MACLRYQVIFFFICLSCTVYSETKIEDGEGEMENVKNSTELDTEVTNGTWLAPEYIRKNFPYYVSGHDNDGRPIFVFEYGKYDYAKALAMGEEMEQNLTRYWDQANDNMLRMAKANEKDGPGEIVMIIDFDEFSIEHVSSVAVTRFVLKMFTKYAKVTEKLGYGFLLNTNFASASFVDVGRPFLGEFLQRFEVYGSNKEAWIPKLLKKLPRDQLSPAYGGTEDFKPIIVFG